MAIIEHIRRISLIKCNLTVCFQPAPRSGGAVTKLVTVATHMAKISSVIYMGKISGRYIVPQAKF